jgi:hypothetical protein
MMFASLFQNRRTLLSVALALGLLALALPAVAMGHGTRCAVPDWASGWMLLVTGPLGLMVGQFGWLANPLMLLAAIFKRIELAAIAVGLIVLTAITFTSLPTDNGTSTMCGFGPGFYVWLACSVVILFSTFVKPGPLKAI